MFFEWAFPVLRGGGRVRQEDWPTSDYWFIKDGRIWRHTMAGDKRVDEVGPHWIVSRDDWVLWEPEPKKADLDAELTHLEDRLDTMETAEALDELERWICQLDRQMVAARLIHRRLVSMQRRPQT